MPDEKSRRISQARSCREFAGNEKAITMPEPLPQLNCRQLPAFDADNLDAVRGAFAAADKCAMQQAWQPKPDADFTPATVSAGWRVNSLLVFAELDDADIFTRATASNQRMWELGDVLEMFLSPESSGSYVDSGRKLLFSGLVREVEAGGDTMLIIISEPCRSKPPRFSGDRDTTPVGLDLRFQAGRLQAASAKVSPRVRWRASNSRPMTCRL